MTLGEFDLIERMLRPLTRGYPGALNLTDDAALVRVPAGRELVVAKDAMVADVHFLADDPPDLVGGKLLRVNLSDLAAMGADPLGYLLVIARSPDVTDEWLQSFASGLLADQNRFGCHLLGGDTVSTPGPLTLSLTILGTVPEGSALLRSGAKAGDDVWVSGCLGDAALGLRVLRGLAVTEDEALALVDRYRTPRPRLALGTALRGIASAAIDVSDGLVADLGHICETSGVGATLDASLVPLSPAGRRRARRARGGADRWRRLRAAVHGASGASGRGGGVSPPGGVSVTRIGTVRPGPGLDVVDAAGQPVPIDRTGWTHF